jgi:hypothetical protein
MYSFQIDFTDGIKFPNLKENILNDYEIIQSMYLDNFEKIEYLDNEDVNLAKNILFKMNLKLEMEIDEKFAEIINEMKFPELLISKNVIGLPYWIQFDFNFDVKLLNVSFFVFWLKKNKCIFDNFKDIYCESINDESIFFTIIENFKNFIQSPEKTILLNWLQQMKEEFVIKNGKMSLEKFIYGNDSRDNQNNEINYLHTDNDDNLSILKARSEKMLEHSKVKQMKSNTTKEEDITITKNDNDNNQEYLLFFKEGGVVGEVISDRGSTFQAHAIKIYSLLEMNKYLSYLKTNNKILKATHNIVAYRFQEKTNNKNNKIKKIISEINDNTLTQGFDDDGEDDAGIRLLGILQKMKITNVLVVVSRWFGGTLLGNDRFKHINDSAKNLLNSNKNIFEYTS